MSKETSTFTSNDNTSSSANEIQSSASSSLVTSSSNSKPSPTSTSQTVTTSKDLQSVEIPSLLESNDSTPQVEQSQEIMFTPSPSEPMQTNIDILIYFDKYYSTITIFFVVIILLLLMYSYSSFIPSVILIYVVVMLIVFWYRNFKITQSPQMDSYPVSEKKTYIPSTTNEVFHIPSNLYTFKDAKAVCKAYDSRLATYSEIEDAYINGADWCSYGWSEDQNAFFPTQQAHYDLLQKIPGHEHDCGRPGVNGGYMKNPNLRFGVNCYGKKPPITPNEEEYMAAYSPYPLTKEDIELDKKVSYLKNNLQNILISPFNPVSWNASPPLNL